MAVEQIGSYEQCARADCPVKSPGWRVILGHFRVQVYVCASHLVWATSLDLLSQDTGKALGWEYGYSTSCATMVISEMPTIKRAVFNRDESKRISASFPNENGGYH